MRILFYSPDSYGLGHVRRTLSISEKLSQADPGRSALLLTGAPRAHYFRYPERCDWMKLPSITKAPDGRYVSAGTDMTIEETVRLRERLIHEAAESFRPDLFLVDHSPLGLCGEVLPTLHALQKPGRCLRVLGLRDVIDQPEAVRAAWSREGVVDVLRHSYDLVLVYGQRDFFDPILEYEIPEDVARKFIFVGYISRNGCHTDPDEARRLLAPRTGRLVAVTAGGGGDGYVLIRTFIDAYESLGPQPPFEAYVVTGPLMSPKKRLRLQSQAARLPGLTVDEYSTDIPGTYRAADLVVSMGGYNSVSELAYVGARALIVPRTFPRQEQLVRAERLDKRGVARCLRPETLDRDSLAAEILAGLDRPRPPRRWGLELSGLDNVVRAVTRRTATRAAS